MDAEFLIGSIIRGALSGGRKRGYRAHHYLRGGAGSFLNTGTLMTLAGLAWGAFESMKTPGMPGPARPSGPPPPPGYGPVGGAGVPPVPGGAPTAGRRADAPPPPVPAPPSGAVPVPGVAPPAPTEGIPAGVVRMIRLTISAARADGTLSGQERAAILDRAREAGIESLVEAELRSPRPLSDIISGVTDPSMRRDLYVLAFTIVRADEQVTGAERIYLAQLASLLGLDADTVARLEADTAAQIDAQPDRPSEAGTGAARE